MKIYMCKINNWRIPCVLYIFSIIFTSTISFAQEGIKSKLCNPPETDIFSFKLLNSKKLAALCIGPHEKYIVYRFGTKDNIELQFPPTLDSNSWKKFYFQGYQRGGDAGNDPFGNFKLRFDNGSASYTLYQEWDGDSKPDIGIWVSTDKGHINLSGSLDTQNGSLILLNDETNIKNHWNGDN